MGVGGPPLARAPIGVRWLYLFIKWSLIALGAYLLVGHYVLTWGWYAALGLVALGTLLGAISAHFSVKKLLAA